MSFLTFVVVGQLVVAVIVVVILRLVLNNMLVELAVKHLEVWRTSKVKDIDHILVLTHKPLKKSYVDRIIRAAEKNFYAGVAIDFRIKKSLLGGAVVQVGDQVLDCSLRGRLRQAIQMG